MLPYPTNTILIKYELFPKKLLHTQLTLAICLLQWAQSRRPNNCKTRQLVYIIFKANAIIEADIIINRDKYKRKAPCAKSHSNKQKMRMPDYCSRLQWESTRTPMKWVAHDTYKLGGNSIHRRAVETCP